MMKHVIVDDSATANFEIAVVDDVIYSEANNLEIFTINNVLMYADLKNDSTGGVFLEGLTSVVVGTGFSWLPSYPQLSPAPVYAPPVIRDVEIGSADGITSVDGGIYTAVLSPDSAGYRTQVGRKMGSTSASVYVYAGNVVVVQAGEQSSSVHVGFGSVGSGVMTDIDVDISVIVEEGNLWLVGDIDYALIGNANAGGSLLAGSIYVFAHSVPANIPMNGNIFIHAGSGLGAQSRIGHWRITQSSQATDVSGSINAIGSSSVDIRSGLSHAADAAIGHIGSSGATGADISVLGPINVEGQKWSINLDAAFHGGGSPSHCQIGHTSAATLANGLCQDSIFLFTEGKVNCFAGSGTEEFVLIGHRGYSSVDDLSGDIEINAGDSIVVASNSGIENFAQVGHYNTGGTGTSGDITIRSGARQLFTSALSDDASSFTRVGHNGNFTTGNIYMLAFENIDLESSIFPGGPPVLIYGVDTVRLTSADSIMAYGNENGVEVTAIGLGCVVDINAANNISFLSSTGPFETLVSGVDASLIRCQSSGDISLSQSDLNTSFTTGEIVLHADKTYLPDELYGNQLVQGTRTVTNLTGNLQINADSFGVVKFENPGGSTWLTTVDGDILIYSAEKDADHIPRDILLTDVLPLSVNPTTQNGTIFINMYIDLSGDPQEFSGGSFRNGIIEEWNPNNNGKLFFDAKNTIDVINSFPHMHTILLHTN